ncbi:MAG: polysaccharide biosynthesis tyrosine autokinase [Synechococcales cyanobacterium]
MVNGVRLPDAPLPEEISASGSEINWRDAIQRQWIPALGTVVAVLSGFFFYTKSLPLVYQGQALILLSRTSTLSVLDQLNPVTSNTQSRSTEIEIFTSLPLIENAIAQLPDSSLNPQLVRDSLSVRQIPNSDVINISYSDTNPERVKAVLDVLSETYISYSLESTRSEATNAIRFIENQLPAIRSDLADSAQKLREFQEETGILDAQAYSQAFATVIQGRADQKLNLELEQERLIQQEPYLLSQLSRFDVKTSDLLSAIVVSEDEEISRLTTQLFGVESELSQAQLQYQADSPNLQALQINRDRLVDLIRQRANSLFSQAPELSSSAPISQVPILSELPTTLSEEDSSLASGADLPVISSETVRSLIRDLQTNRLNQFLTQIQIDSLTRVESELQRQLNQLPQYQQIYRELLRQYERDSATLDTFLQQLRNLQITEAQQISPWRVLQPARIPTQPISPSLSRNLVLGLFSGLMAAGAIVYLIETLDQRVKSVDDVKKLLDLPVLGTFPIHDINLAQFSAIMDDKDTQLRSSKFIEAVRFCALNILYLGTNEQTKLLGYTSSVSEEGKSSSVHVLGHLFSELGYNVLIVDADLRRPTQHLLFQVPNAVGLSSVLTGQRDWPSILFKPKSNLHFLSAGPTPPSPVSLFKSTQMERVLREFRQHYDYVLFDTAPVLPVADTQSLANQLDGVVLVVSLDKSPRQGILQTVELLGQSKSNVAGMIINRVKVDRANYYYYNYYDYRPRSEQSSSNGHVLRSVRQIKKLLGLRSSRHR